MKVYEDTKSFPASEKYNLTSQLRRAALSVPANIVEGASRQHKKEYLNFLYTARASNEEAGYFIDLANRLAYLSDDSANELMTEYSDTAKTLHGLINAVHDDVFG